jgi:hypothetical protein
MELAGPEGTRVGKTTMTKRWVERQQRHQMENPKALAEAKVPVPA